MRKTLSIWRGLRVAENALTGAAILGLVTLTNAVGLRCAWLPGVVRWWHRRLCRCLAIRMRVNGALAPRVLLVANHVSWLDVPVLGAQGRIGFLSKSEVRDWPLIGWMSAVAGTLFIERGAYQAARLITRIGERVSDDRPVAIFAEGTTSNGLSVRRFHPRLFAAAQRPGVRVQPVALRYGRDGQADLLTPFVGDDELIPHLLRLLRQPAIDVEVSFLEPIEPDGMDRRSLADAARAAIADRLGLPLSPLEPPPRARTGAMAMAGVVPHAGAGRARWGRP